MEIGGYFGIERLEGKEFHSEAVRFNYARCCLRYIIQARKIAKIYIPYYCCDSVIKACSDIQVEYYHISKSFQPLFEKKLKENEFVYLINYYGELPDAFIKGFVQKHQNVIVDNVQSFYSKPIKDVDSIYSCRKYFGVPDGAYLYTNLPRIHLERQSAIKQMEYLIGRQEQGASRYYPQYSASEEYIDERDIKGMSWVSQYIMSAVNYDSVAEKRADNFRFLHKKLSGINQISVNGTTGPYAYPFYVEDGEMLRKELINQKIYIPILWQNVLYTVKEDSVESKYVKNLLPIPCDQRYGQEEMSRIVCAIMKFISKRRVD